MIQEALQYLVELGASDPYHENINGINYSDRSLHVIKPPRAMPLQFSRLQGFADFANLKNEDFGDRSHLVIHVESPWCVRLTHTLDATLRDREDYALAEFEAARIFPFGKFMASEEFVIAAMTLIADSDKTDRARLLSLVGNVGAEQITNLTDDGVSQQVAVKAGVTLVNRRKIDNPFKLAPFRSFAELKQQPASPFILRARQADATQVPTLALFECDNGAWQIDAIEGIADWLKSKIKDIPILA